MAAGEHEAQTRFLESCSYDSLLLQHQGLGTGSLASLRYLLLSATSGTFLVRRLRLGV